MSQNNPQTTTRSQVANQILETINKKSHCLILSFSGNGCGYFLENLLIKNKVNFAFINLDSPSSNLNTINIVTIYPNQLIENINKIDTLFSSASADQKFIIVSEYPSLLTNQSYSKSKFSKHIYKHFYLPTLDPTETKQMIASLNPNLISQAAKIYTLTGGISRLVKQYCIDSQSITNQILDSIYTSINHSPSQTLQLLKLTKHGSTFSSSLLDQYIKDRTQETANIQINPDLTIQEDHQPNQNTFTKSEIDILSTLLNNQIVDRDNIALVKWGNLADEKYSDEAINKSISRLNSKLNFHLIQSIPKLGYKLTKK